MRCPACQHDNSPTARMCGRCGGSVAAPSPGHAGLGGGASPGMSPHELRVGRDPSCAIALPVNDSRVSRFHARIWPLGGGRFRIVDDNSANGVYLNGRRVAGGEFGLGDQVSLGSFPFDPRLLTRYDPAALSHAAGALGAHPEGAARMQGPALGPLTVGREDTCDIVLPGAAGQVSRQHATLERQADGRCLVRDLDSANGVFVNGQRVPASLVAPGDHVSLGSYAIDPFALLSQNSGHGAAGAHVPGWAPAALPQHGRPQADIAPQGQPETHWHDGAARSDEEPHWNSSRQRRGGRSSAMAIAAIIVVVAAAAAGLVWMKQSGSLPGVGAASVVVISPVQALQRLRNTLNQRPQIARNIAGYDEQMSRVEPLARQVISTEGALRTVERVRNARVWIMGREIPVWDRLKHLSPEVASLDELAEQMHAAVRAAREIVALRAELQQSSANFQQRWALAESGPSGATLAASTSAAAALASVLARVRRQAQAVHEKLERARRTVESVGAALGVATRIPVVGRFAGMAAEAIADLESAIAEPGRRFKELASQIAADIDLLKAFSSELKGVEVAPHGTAASPPEQA